MEFYAHTAQGPDGKQLLDRKRWQLLREHLSRVADLARTFAVPLNLSVEAEMVGLLHDLGKYTTRFQSRLEDNSIHGVNHWAAGAALAAKLNAWSVAFAASGHHTGIPALNETDAGIPLRMTVQKFKQKSDRMDLTGQCPESLDDLLASLEHDGLNLPPFSPVGIPKDRFFEEALRIRLLFSCLVDADFLDTENHFDASQSANRSVPDLQAERALMILKAHLECKPTGGFINDLRRQLLDDCLKAAQKPQGLFTLTAPTGSGKTLSSLAFALQHIVHHNSKLDKDDPRKFRRIIVVIPYTSIIEQTAQVYREIFEQTLGKEDMEFVLEHHSAVAPREQKKDQSCDAEEARLRRARLSAENWASPLVVTTNVQFFQSLFSNRPSDCRKLHNIGRSVVLFDEVQTLPPRLVPSLLSAVRLLTRDYGVTAVFMTATQPAFATAGDALPYDWNPQPISTNEAGLADALRRTRIQLPRQGEQFTWAEIAEKLTATPQSLCVVNTTRDARELFRLVRESQPDAAFHLSARMCPAHRQEKLKLLRTVLLEGNPCRLVSTQLIEAGVDVDFPIAYRALGPLDSIIQTAGRCNREGRSSDPRPVIVFRPKDGGHLPKGYEQVMRITESFLARKSEAESRIHQPSFYAEYFAELYKLVGRDSADADPVFAASKQFNFPKAAEECQLVGNETHAVLVKWKRGAELAEKLRLEKHLTASECRQAQRFSVNLYQSEFFDAQARGYIYQPAKDWDFWVWNSEYDEHLGLGHLDANSYCL